MTVSWDGFRTDTQTDIWLIPDNDTECLPVVEVLLARELVGGGGDSEALIVTTRHAGLPLSLIINLSIFSWKEILFIGNSTFFYTQIIKHLSKTI